MEKATEFLFARGNMSREDISMGTERMKISVMSKASAISPQIVGRTIGPNCVETPPCAESHISRTEEWKSFKSLVRPIVKANTSISDTLSLLTNTKTNYKRNEPRCIGKMLFDLELERQAEVREAMSSHLRKFKDNTMKRQAEEQIRQAHIFRDRECRAQLENQQIQSQLLEQQYQESQRIQKLAIEKQKRDNERNQLIKQAEQRAEEDKKQKEEKHLQIKKIKQCVCEFQEKYQRLRESVKSCQDQQALMASTKSSFQTLKSLDEALKQLENQCMVGAISNLDNQTAAAILQQLDNSAKVIQETVKRINKECEKRLESERLVAEQELAKSASLEVTPVTPVATTVTTQIPLQRVSVSEEPSSSIEKRSSLGCLENCVDKDSLQRYATLIAFLGEYHNALPNPTQNPELKEFLFNCKKAVNIPVNAISDVSGTHLHDKLKKLTFILLGQQVAMGGPGFTASAHPQGIAYCMDFLAKKLASQGRATVSSKPETAFPIAAVIVALWAEFPVFGQLLLAHLYRVCPYLVPLYLPQVEGQTDRDYYKSLGYHYDESGQVEEHNKFLNKMAGVMHLYAAIMVTKIRASQKATHPHGLGEAWHWIACFVNLDPRPDISATLLLTFLEVTGSALAAAYGQQFKKLLHLICKEYFPKVKKIDEGGPVSRLEAFLQSILKKGTIPQPSGMLHVNFW